MTSAAAARSAKTVEKMSAAPKTNGRRSSKPQAPNPKEASSTKLQERLHTSVLGFGTWSFFGAFGTWDLELPAPLRSSGRARRFIEIEFHFRRFFRAGRRREERPRLEAKHLVQHVGREAFQRGVVLLHRGVEIVSL